MDTPLVPRESTPEQVRGGKRGLQRGYMDELDKLWSLGEVRIISV